MCDSRSVVFDSVTPRTVARQAPLSMGFSSQEYWSGLPFPSPGDLLNPGIELRSSALQADSLLSEPPGKPKNTGVGSHSLLQGIFLTQGSNSGLPHCRWVLYCLSHPGASGDSVLEPLVGLDASRPSGVRGQPSEPWEGQGVGGEGGWPHLSRSEPLGYDPPSTLPCPTQAGAPEDIFDLLRLPQHWREDAAVTGAVRHQEQEVAAGDLLHHKCPEDTREVGPWRLRAAGCWASGRLFWRWREGLGAQVSPLVGGNLVCISHKPLQLPCSFPSGLEGRKPRHLGGWESLLTSAGNTGLSQDYQVKAGVERPAPSEVTVLRLGHKVAPQTRMLPDWEPGGCKPVAVTGSASALATDTARRHFLRGRGLHMCTCTHTQHIHVPIHTCTTDSHVHIQPSSYHTKLVLSLFCRWES